MAAAVRDEEGIMSAPQSLAEPATEPHPAPPPVQMVQLLAGFQAGFAFDAVTATPTPVSIVRALA
jgi:hypothetical protein